jgi:hypothetical protein
MLVAMATMMTMATTMMVTMMATMTTMMTGNDNNDDGGGSRRAMAAADGMLWAGIRWPEAAEIGIKQKCEQCGYDKWKFLFSKIVTWVYF